MKKTFVLIVTIFYLGAASFAQNKFFTKTGYINFNSKASAEEIDAKNKTVTTVLDTKSGAVQFAVLMKGFEFDKQLMQQHFNENYVESDKYPRAAFTGIVTNNASVNYTKEGSYPAKVAGKLSIHGVTKEIHTEGMVKVDDGKIQLTSAFNILLSDYKISIPAVVKDKIANSIKVSVDCKLDPIKKS